MNIGKLYQVKKFYWFLYPSKEIAVAALDPHLVAVVNAHGAAHPTHAFAKSFSAIYSERFNCNVSYIEPSIFCLLEKDGDFIKILSTNGEVGWIYLTDWCKNDIEEMNQ
jgi:hypothetical protein